MSGSPPEPLSARAWSRLRSMPSSVSEAVRVPEPLARARWLPSRRAVLGVLIVVGVVVLVVALRVTWVRAATQVIPIPARAGPVVSTVGVGAAPSSAAAGAPVVVHVVGAVARPGLLTLPPGSRVGDAVKAAGGVAQGADVAAINLARVIVDGEQIRVPRKGEAVSAEVAPGASTAGGPLSLNTADLGALDGLPGVGPVLAARIVEWRRAHGRFTNVEELGEVSGIGERLLTQLRPLVTV